MEKQAEAASQYLLHTQSWSACLSHGRCQALGQVRPWHLPPLGKSMGVPRAVRGEEDGCTGEMGSELGNLGPHPHGLPAFRVPDRKPVLVLGTRAPPTCPLDQIWICLLPVSYQLNVCSPLFPNTRIWGTICLCRYLLSGPLLQLRVATRHTFKEM